MCFIRLAWQSVVQLCLCRLLISVIIPAHKSLCKWRRLPRIPAGNTKTFLHLKQQRCKRLPFKVIWICIFEIYYVLCSYHDSYRNYFLQNFRPHLEIIFYRSENSTPLSPCLNTLALYCSFVSTRVISDANMFASNLWYDWLHYRLVIGWSSVYLRLDLSNMAAFYWSCNMFWQVGKAFIWVCFFI